VFKKRIIRKMFVLMRKLNNEELHNLFSSLNETYYQDDQIRKGEIGGTCSTHGRDENCI
jgi:hypothetical protein